MKVWRREPEGEEKDDQLLQLGLLERGVPEWGGPPKKDKYGARYYIKWGDYGDEKKTVIREVGVEKRKRYLSQLSRVGKAGRNFPERNRKARGRKS